MTSKEKFPDTLVFHYYNANPKNRITGDCWLRAICTGLDEPYNEVLREMVEVHIKTGYELSCDKAVEKYLTSKGWKKMKQPRKEDNTKYTGKEWCEWLDKNDNRNKRIICNIGGHHMVAIVKDNLGFRVNDIWNSTCKCIGNYYVKGDN